VKLPQVSIRRKNRQVKGSSEKPPPGKNGYQYREQYGVVVICKDAAHQERVYWQLLRLGFQLKVVVV